MSIGGIIQEPDVFVEVGAVGMAEALHIAFVADAVAEVIVLTRAGEGFFVLRSVSEDGVVDDDSVDFGVVVGFVKGSFYVEGVGYLSEFVAESVGSAGFSGPFCVLFGGWVVVCE